jgi:hypothetical protein
MDSMKYNRFLWDNNIRCINGKWCDNDKGFSCSDKSAKGGCYQAMHIISESNSLAEFPEKYDRNILGNRIMAYSSWVSGTGKAGNWENDKVEKKDVLSKSIFDAAAWNVKMCYEKSIGVVHPPESDYKHTTTYNEWKAGVFNYNDFFMRDSYGGFLNIDPCTPMPSSQSSAKKKFISILKENRIECEGRWCIDDEWKCGFGNSEECYNLEHIIDKKNSDVEFGDTYNKNILGNFIFAYGLWNQQIGRIKDWPSIKNEKREIYGNIFEQAYQSVRDCPDTKYQSSLYEDVSDNYGWIIFGLAIGGTIGFYIICKHRLKVMKIRNDDENIASPMFSVENEIEEENNDYETVEVKNENPNEVENQNL